MTVRQLRVLGHMLRLSLRADARRSVLMMVLIAVQAGSAALTAVNQRWLIDSAGLGLVAGVLGAAALGMTLHAVDQAGGLLERNWRTDVSQHVDLRVHQEILALSARIPTIEHLERPEYLDRLTLLRKSTRELATSCWATAHTAASLVSLGLTVWLLAAVHPLLTVPVALAAVPLFCGNRARRVEQRAADQTAELERVERRLHEMCTTPEPAKELRISGSGPTLSDRADELLDRALRIRGRAMVRAAVWQLAGWLCYVAGFLTGLGVVAQLVIDGRASVGDIVLVISLSTQLRRQLAEAIHGILQLGRAGHVSGHYHWLRTYAAAESSGATGTPPDRLARGITLSGVRFRYPGSDRDVLDGIDLHLPAGRTVALVGINGAGKTTLVKLLTGLYRPNEGGITVDGVPLPELSPAAWRSRVTGTFQDFVAFELRARETVGVGNLPRAADPDAVRAAVAATGAGTVIDSLPDGLETQLGRVFDGAQLSQGQWQKLALARGHMRTDPLLLVLDEPTAALDPQAEHDLYERFVDQARATTAQYGTITLVVSHRFSTVRMADLIVVLQDGRIAEQGTHEDLLSADGPYARLYRIQARQYS
ncbi:ABC transporter ATP-binding protein [Streptomyces sp. B6B3]|uniref:ABC transporter ATP-binding protein n=1 Tax=Streptomyces sp. B6B3 TaxID=3153570 RepID=UPI00325E9AB5